MGFLGLLDVPRDEDANERFTSAVVAVVGHSEPCGCHPCSAAGRSRGSLIQETHVGIGLSKPSAVRDALRQAHERHHRAELAVESWRELAHFDGGLDLLGPGSRP